MYRIFLILTGLGLGQFANAATYVFPGELVDIPTIGPANPSFVYVEGVEGTISNISIKFNGLEHRYGRETMIALSNPDGWATLIWDAPHCKFSDIDVLIADNAALSLEDNCKSGQSLESGPYLPGYSNAGHQFTIPIAPVRPLFHTMSELLLPNMNGRWILWVEDFSSGDGGEITSWEIIVETEKEP